MQVLVFISDESEAQYFAAPEPTRCEGWTVENGGPAIWVWRKRLFRLEL